VMALDQTVQSFEASDEKALGLRNVNALIDNLVSNSHHKLPSVVDTDSVASVYSTKFRKDFVTLVELFTFFDLLFKSV